MDYTCRGPELEDFALLFFLVNTYDTDIPKESCAEEETRPRNPRIFYTAQHPHWHTRYRVLRTKGHNTLPAFVGRYFPRADDAELRPFYCASVLVLLKPWRRLSELRLPGCSWEQSLQAFLDSASKCVHDIIGNIQFFYDSRDAAAKRRLRELQEDSETRYSRHMFINPADEEGEEGNSEAFPIDLSDWCDEDFEDLERSFYDARELFYGFEAVQLAQSAGVFSRSENLPGAHTYSYRTATSTDLRQLEQWEALLLKDATEQVKARHLPQQAETSLPTNSVQGLAAVLTDVLPLTQEDLGLGQGLEPAELSSLNDAQRRAHDMVIEHLRDTLAGKRPPQLKMIIYGEGGTGKSKVIQTITESFRQMDRPYLLVKASYTGIAASIINGFTIHNIGKIPVNGSEPSKEAFEKLVSFWALILYLIIDEMSMLPKNLFAMLSRIVTKANSRTDPTNDGSLPFGGVNVILCGDFHQLPPVANAHSALYIPLQAKDTEKQKQGRIIYEQFDKVVILEEQMRVTDPVWTEFLRRARYGRCSPDDLKMLDELTLGNPACPVTDFTQPPWSNAVLITPRHSARMQWNDAAVEKHCQRTGQRLLISRARDTIRGRPLSLPERYAVATKQSQRRKGRRERSGLPNSVPLAIGLEVMVTMNIHTDLDVANGARGQIVGIVLDPDEPPLSRDPSQSEVKLQFPPAYVLVKLHQTKAKALPGLEAGVIPIKPVKKTFTISVAGQDKVVTRIQLPITPAYGFTDHRAQGQTISKVIADLSTPPTGGITPFDAYVTLSRSQGRNHIRLLRKFDPSLFTKHPSEFLRIEDQRLAHLANLTKIAWDNRNG